MHSRQRPELLFRQGGLLPESTETAVACREVKDRLAEVLLSKIRPVFLADIQLGVTDLPEQKIADSIFGGCTNHEIRIGHTPCHQCSGDGFLCDRFRGKTAFTCLSCKLLHGLTDFGPGAVVDGEAKSHSAVVLCFFCRPQDLFADHGGKFTCDSDCAEPESLRVDFFAFFHQVVSEQSHQKIQFGWRSFPVLAGKAVQRELFKAQAGRLFNNSSYRTDSAAMPFDSGEALRLRPASIAVHDDRDVTRQTIRIKSEAAYLLSCIRGFSGQRPAPVNDLK